MNKTLTTREKLDMAFRHINRENQSCFGCCYGYSWDAPEGKFYLNEGNEGQQTQLRLVLLGIGVQPGVYKTFHVREDMVFSRRGCGLSDKPDPHWQEFIGEVVSLVGE